jgi:hypothetical protein
MKKILLLTITVILTAFSFNAAAQDSKLYGKWSLNISNMTEEERNMIEKMDFEFAPDKTGKFLLNGKFADSVPDTEYTMSMTIKFACDFTWGLTDNFLELKFKSIDLGIDNFTILPQSTETESLAAMLQTLITKEIKKNKETLQAEFLKELGVLENNTAEIEFVNDNTFKFKEDDSVIFIRSNQ